RAVQPSDNGYLTQGHAEYASQRETKGRLQPFPGLKRKPMRARDGANVTQMHYARRGIITPEMEFIAIRENLGRQSAFEACYKSGTGGIGNSGLSQSGASNVLNHQHPGRGWGAQISKFITPEFVRDEV